MTAQPAICELFTSEQLSQLHLAVSERKARVIIQRDDHIHGGWEPFDNSERWSELADQMDVSLWDLSDASGIILEGLTWYSKGGAA